MDWKEVAEDFWDSVKDHGYYIAGVAALILIPFLIGAPGFSELPLLSNIYEIGRKLEIFPNNKWFLVILSYTLIFAIFAASWDFLCGYTGQISFGHAIFWGVSAYSFYWIASSASFLITQMDITLLPFDPLIALILSGIASALLALVIGIIALRLKGPYLALVTMIVPLIAAQIFVQGELAVTGGEYGVSLIGTLIIDYLGIPYEQYALNFYLFTLLVFFISIGIMMLIAFSRVGLAFKSIREDEDAAESLGINLSFYKILAFVISAFFAGIAGCMMAQSPMFRVANSSFFGTSISFTVIIYVVIGGIGTITGGVVGAFVMIYLIEFLLDPIFSHIIGFDLLALAIVLIISLRYLPFGLVRATKDQKRALSLGVLFAFAWAIIPSSEGFGVNLLTKHVLPGTEQANTLLGKLVSIFVEAITTLIGKIDMLGIMAGGYDMTYLGGPLTLESFLVFISLLIMFISVIPAILIFFIGEIIGLFIIEGIMGLHLSGENLISAKFFIYIIVGIPYAYYFPKLFKTIRLKYWGVWPSIGRYEPD